MNRYRDYDPFAWLYTSYWGDEFHEQAIPVLDRAVLSCLPAHASILDVCCGDGRITHMLARRGFQMSGLDGSEEMLTYARQRNSKIRFLLADARSFRLPAEFDAAISTFDSLNHVMNVRDLKRVFRSVERCLKPGGWFVFDLNREEAYRDLWIRTFTSVDKKAASIARGSYDEKRRTARCEVTLFRQSDDHWQRSDFALTQKFHAEEEVHGALRAEGFTSIESLDATGDLGMRGDIGYGRTFFRARKTM